MPLLLMVKQMFYLSVKVAQNLLILDDAKLVIFCEGFFYCLLM